MGADSSKQKPTNEDFQKLTTLTHFNEEQLHILWDKFDLIARSKTPDGVIDMEEFRATLNLSSVGYAKRIFSAFDSNNDQKIQFDEFSLGLSLMCTQATVHEKCKFCFLVYDIDRDGYISRDELKEVLLYSLTINNSVQLDENQLNTILLHTFRSMDKNGDNRISFDEFETYAKSNKSILNALNFSVESLGSN